MSATAQSKEIKRTTSPRDQGRILLVTDDPSMGAYGAEFERAGFNVVSVARGIKALVELGRTRPHVVVADVNLRGVTSEELARKLSLMQEEKVPLILVGNREATVAERGAALALGAFDYFQLPRELTLLVARAAQVIALKQTTDRLRVEAERDYMTGLANRRRFRAALRQELERYRRYDLPCALLLVDIDHLKRINDTHGHTAGDVVICHVARALAQFSRDNDTSARLGGEEFALLLAGADGERALAAAERLREAVSFEPLETIGTVTISVGVAACPAHSDSERTLYAASDAALYRAKREGRNRAMTAELVSA